MKKEIMDLITVPEDRTHGSKRLSINGTFALIANFIAVNGYNISLTEAEFDHINLDLIAAPVNGKEYGISRVVKSREYGTMVKEISEAIIDMSAEIGRSMAQEFAAGHIW